MVSATKLLDILGRIWRRNIVVLGDLMLDRYIWGAVTRISPEAPVPIVEVESESFSLGGAANVANNVQALGARVIPIGVVGHDNEGQSLISMAAGAGFETGGIIIDTRRPTTVKTRVIAHNQHVVRIDQETRETISAQTYEKILSFIKTILPTVDAMIIEDYNKGLIHPELVSEVIECAAKRKIITAVDPKFDNFWAYKGVTVFKPNRREAEAVLGVRLDTQKEVMRAAQKLQKKLECENVLITLGERGLHLLDLHNNHHAIPTRAKKVHDVSGAGDTVIGTLTAALAAGASILEAAHLANFAAGVVVAEVGAVPISPSKLREAIMMYERKD